MEEAAGALEILKRAMQVEQEGREFYLKAAQTTHDKKGQETYAALADDEQKHFSLILRQFQALSQDGEWTRLPEVKPVAIALDKPLFPKGKKALEEAVKATSADSEALLFGMDIEIRSYEMYRKAAVQTADPLGKDMFRFLAGEEKGHFEILMMRFDFLFGPVSWTS